MESLAYNFAMEDTKPTFTTATDMSSATTAVSNFCLTVIFAFIESEADLVWNSLSLLTKWRPFARRLASLGRIA